jgi:hypothetical protein
VVLDTEGYAMQRVVSIVLALIFFMGSYCLAAPESTVSGTYINKTDKEYLTLHPDSRVSLKLRKKPPDLENPFQTLTGTYRLSGEEIIFEFEDGGEASGTIKGNEFIDNEGKTWLKEGTSEPMKTDATTPKGKRK